MACESGKLSQTFLERVNKVTNELLPQVSRTRYEDEYQRFIKWCTIIENLKMNQRCRERVKARRGAVFDHLRSLNSEESVRSALSQLIDYDLRELQSTCSFNESNNDDCTGMDIDEDQPLHSLAVSEREKWILYEYEKLIEDTNAQAELADQVACPMCKGGELKLEQPKGVVACSLCSLQLPGSVPLSELERLIVEAVDRHEHSCTDQPYFTTCPDHTFNLFLLCSTCSYFHQIV